MPAVMEAIDRMSADERIKTMEYLWAAMTAAAEPEPPAWHGDILAERRSRGTLNLPRRRGCAFKRRPCCLLSI